MQGREMVVAVSSPPSPAPPPSTGRPHPTYKEMVVQALTELREPRGSSRSSIARYIAGRFTGLPVSHDALLSVHLRRLRSQGILHLMPGNFYLLATAAAPPAFRQKRGPGRPRKNAADSLAPFQGVKRGPGRPRKNAAPLPPGIKRGPGRPPKNSTPVGVKRGPGRQRKNPMPTAMPGGKRGRGRPRKNAPVPNAHSGFSALALLSLVAGKASPARQRRPPMQQPGYPVAALTERGPGRSRKEKILGVEHSNGAADAPPGQAAGTMTNVGEAIHLPSFPTDKRGRGRPRKRPLEETETTALVVKRRRGRPRKPARSADVATMGPKRGRGRPRKENKLGVEQLKAGGDVVREMALTVVEFGEQAVDQPAAVRNGDEAGDLPFPTEKRGRGRPRKRIGGALVEQMTQAGVEGQPGQAADQPGAVGNGVEAGGALVEQMAQAGVEGQPGQAADQPGAVGNGVEAGRLPSLTEKRGRGRPRKRARGALVGQMAQAGVEGQPQEAADQPGAVRNGGEAGNLPSLTPKRGRGRPRKMPLETETTTSVKRGRGRPRKNASLTEYADTAFEVPRYLPIRWHEKDKDPVLGEKTEIKGVLSEEMMETRPADVRREGGIAHVDTGGAVSRVDPINSDMGTTSL